MRGVRLLARLAHVEISSKFSACARFAAHDLRFHFDRSLLVVLSWVNAHVQSRSQTLSPP